VELQRSVRIVPEGCPRCGGPLALIEETMLSPEMERRLPWVTIGRSCNSGCLLTADACPVDD
jgi:hypothetical protein